MEQHQTQLLIIQLIQAPNIPYAHKLFNLIPNKTVFLYNKLIQAYSSVNQSHQCLTLYSQMCLNNCSPNEHSFIFLFPACAALSFRTHGQILHTHLIKSGFGVDCYALAALLDMYSKLRMLPLARKVFDEMRVRNVPTWNALISGCSRCGDMNEALELFKSMSEKNVMENGSGVKPNRVTIASVLPTCASLGALEVGERIEAYARKNGLFEDLYVSNTILEMHARCGKIEVAKRVFDEIGKRRNLCSWNSMIVAFALHGKSIEALEYYDQLLHEGTAPDDVTFVGVLLACTHGGLVMEGQELFESMARNYSINPKLEHYGCMVDLLGRAGALKEGYDLIKTMPMKPDAVVWGALLGACSFHNNVELAEKAAQPLHFEPYGKVLHVRIRRNFGFVLFATQEELLNPLKLRRGADLLLKYSVCLHSKLLDRVVSVEYALRDDDERDGRYDSLRRGGGYGPCRRSSSPDYGRACSPVYDRYNGSSYDRETSPNYGKQRSRDYGRYY
ncbi:Pentatricopeptide repeat-containing protein [Hibiscus syriacus]|uniref:Pentatricopeptide repeat-containing protein n=1 Tax=Hibiscus syriacus TaxID=106335 RepID=A0A6A2Y5L4_HIBSY|nr:Pentatricopeptide repeat-containing protein [Hibiscus syriacus]